MRPIKIFVWILILSILLCIFSTTGLADGSVYVDKYTIYAQIHGDGSMSVQEVLTYNFNGSFNGILRDIDTSGASAIEEIQVFESSVVGPESLQDISLKEYIPVEEGNKGDDGVFTIEEQGGLQSLAIFSPSLSERKTFVITYVLRDVITRYEDIGELYWQFVPGNWDFDLENVTVHINVPKGADIEDLKIFGHGPLTGESRRVDAENLIFEAPVIRPGEFLEARLLFPATLVPDIENIISKDALDEIMEEERGWAEEANLERERHARAYSITSGIIGLLLLLNIVIFIYIYKNYDREHKTNRDMRYFRELPGEYSPAEMSVLYNFGTIGTKDIMATMMDLVRRGYLKLETIQVERRVFLVKKQVEDYMFTKIRAVDAGLNSHETYLMGWFIEEIGNGESMTLTQLDSYTQASSRAEKFQRQYHSWQKRVQSEAKQREFFDEDLLRGKLLGGVYGFIQIILSLYFMSLGNLLGAVTLILGVALLIYSIAFKRRSHYGAEQYNLWRAFRRFLLEFSNIKDYTPPSIVIWEHYLVYAISLGVAKEVIKQLQIVIPPEQFSNPSLTYLYASGLNRQFMMMNSVDSMTRTFERTIDTAISKSTESSTTGSGGGFTGGGGGGGGSGGGGGAF